ncbi:MAG: S8 family serine peptidase [Oscillochloridaceae bacterium umkhey_bin13]
MALLFATLLPLGATANTNENRLLETSLIPAAVSAEVERLRLEDGPVHLMLELFDRPAILSYSEALQRPNLSETQAIQVGVNQVERIERAQAQVLNVLQTTAPDVAVLYQVSRTFNGIAVVADASQIAALRQLPGVRAIQRLALHEPNHSTSVPLIGAPDVWQSLGLTGSGIKIGIIDTGIDYVHTMFGGSGKSSDLADARSADNNVQLTGPTDVPVGFTVLNTAGDQLYPSTKVIGGFDFAGDAYNAAGSGAALIPRPDANPMDCPASLGGGHGSHVAGTAGGYGVNANGTTYAGPWDTTTPFSTLRIAPGVAPEAELYALRVFGCTGSTALTTLAIDWSVDPNGDGDFSDRLDVINMSLGATYGTPDDPSARASDNAAAAGVIVVASAGNSGDLYYVSGSPGSSIRTITVASSVDSSDVVDAFMVTGINGSSVEPASFSVEFNWAASAPLTAPLVYDPTFNGCTARPAGTFTGQVVLVDWAPVGTSTFPCGSIARSNNAQNAGAVGIIMASGLPFFDTSIAGNAGIRAVCPTFTVGQTLKAALDAGPVDITFDFAYRNTLTFIRPEADDTLSTFTSRGPRGRDNLLKPDIAAPGQSIFSASAGTGDRGSSLNGTSMAAPHIAGAMALLRQQYPTWSVEELKALVMNTAGNDLFTGVNRTGTKFAPQRVGAGRVDVPEAMANQVIAFDAARPEGVNVSFGFVEVPALLEVERTVRVVNKGTSAATYAIGYDPRTEVPGVSYSFPDGDSVTVAPGGTATFRVWLTADPSLMTNARDSTVSAVNGGNPRHWLNEAAGLITLTPTTGSALRLPVYAVVRPASQMTTRESTIVADATSFTTTLTLDGTPVGDGILGDTNRHNSLVTAFELQGISPQLASLPNGVPASADGVDLQYIGVATNAAQTTAYFAISTWSDLGTLASDNEFDVYIDVNNDAIDDFVLFTTRLTSSDVFVTALINLNAGTSATVQGFTNIFNANTPTATMNNNVLVMPVSIAALGLPTGSTSFNYYVISFSRFAAGVIDAYPPQGYLSFDFANRGVNMVGLSGFPLYIGQPGNEIAVGYNEANYLTNNSRGVLLLHHYNTSGTRAQVVPIVAELELDAPAAKTYGDAPFVITATASLAQAVEYSSTTPEICTVMDDEVTIVGAGDCVVRATTVETFNFGSTFVEQTIPIATAPLTVSIPDVTRTYGAPNPAPTATISGFVYDDDASMLGGTLTFTTTATATSSPGEYPITVEGLTSDNYEISFVDGTLTVTKAPLTVRVNNAIRPVNVPNPAFSATISGFVNAETEAVLGGALTFATTATIDSPPGTYPITATGLTSDNYEIEFIAGTLTVGPIQLYLPLIGR